MKPRVSNQKTAALTLVEVLVVIAVLAVLAIFLFVPWSEWSESSVARKARLINCVNNLKQIGLANRLWAKDHNEEFPAQVSITDTNGGGTMKLAATFQVMSNELYNPRVLVCPADTDRAAATNFTTGFSAQNISYFMGLDADTNHSQMFLSGDDNFVIGGVPVRSGLLEFSTNANIAWTAERHMNAGNVGLADGSVATVTDSGLINLLHQTGVATNRLAIP